MRVRRFRFRRSRAQWGGKPLRHHYVTVPAEVAEKWDEWGVEMVDVIYDPDNPVELRVVPLRAERVT